MMPDLASLTGKGSLLVIEGALKKFAPLDKIASTLNVAQLSAIDLKDLKTYVEFANGIVTAAAHRGGDGQPDTGTPIDGWQLIS